MCEYVTDKWLADFKFDYLWDLYNGWFWQDETEVFGADEDAGGLWQCGFLSGFSGWGI